MYVTTKNTGNKFGKDTRKRDSRGGDEHQAPRKDQDRIQQHSNQTKISTRKGEECIYQYREIVVKKKRKKSMRQIEQKESPKSDDASINKPLYVRKRKEDECSCISEAK